MQMFKSASPSSLTISVLLRFLNVNSRSCPEGPRERFHAMRLDFGITWPHERVVIDVGGRYGNR